jgi:hypothetical protein
MLDAFRNAQRFGVPLESHLLRPKGRGAYDKIPVLGTFQCSGSFPDAVRALNRGLVGSRARGEVPAHAAIRVETTNEYDPFVGALRTTFIHAGYEPRLIPITEGGLPVADCRDRKPAAFAFEVFEKTSR